jgi:hypothetical protein
VKFKNGFIDEQIVENPCTAQKKPGPADTGIEYYNTERSEVHVEFLHGLVCPYRIFFK